MQDKNILVCEETPEGIFSAVYYAYEQKYSPNNTKVEVGEIENYELFANYIQVQTDYEKAKKVDRTIAGKFGEISYSYLWHALYSKEKERGDASKMHPFVFKNRLPNF